MAYIQSLGSDGGTNYSGWTGDTALIVRGTGGVDARINARGVVKEFDVWVAVSAGSPQIKVKIFRDDGTNYVFIGETPLTTVVQGYNLIRAFIPVEKGDYIGIYYDASSNVQPRYDGVSDYGACQYKSDTDVTTTTAKSTWSTGSSRHSLRARIFTRVRPL